MSNESGKMYPIDCVWQIECLFCLYYIEQDSKYSFLRTGGLKQLKETPHLVMDSEERNDAVLYDIFFCFYYFRVVLATFFKHGLQNLQAWISNLQARPCL